MPVINKICAIAYELSFLLFAALLVLAPLHAGATKHLPVAQTIDSTHAIVRGDTRGIHIGDTLPLYRFSYTWKSPIGYARVDSVDGEYAHITTYSMQWPLGQQVAISRAEDGSLFIPTTGLQQQKGDYLNVLRDGALITQATIANIGNSRATLALPPGTDTAGLVAAEFTVLTEAVSYSNPILSSIEIACIAVLLLGYAFVYIRTRQSPFIALRRQVQCIPIPKRAVFWVLNIAAGIPLVWFMTKMPLYLVAYIAQSVTHFFTGVTPYYRPVADTVVPVGYTLVALAYYGYLAWYRTSPVLAFWDLISYKRQRPQTITWKRGLLNWALHLIVVYVFASTLFGFLDGDIRAAVANMHPSSLQGVFEFWKYVIWALTVVGCLIGYGYSIISILWGRYIRNLDFTVTGWLTNGFCYPFLGIIIWQMTPSFTGPSATITDGPVYLLMLTLGLVFNLLYMLSIWNLGTMFDLMADKGVRTSGFYSVVRHPNYALEASMFFVTELVGLTTGIQWLAISMYFFLYWIRSEREDNFMQYSNPAYEPYQKETPWKFVPGLY